MKLLEKQSVQQSGLELGNGLLREANDKLNRALNNLNPKTASVVWAILDIAHSKLDGALKVHSASMA